jgi:hypothetical protein
MTASVRREDTAPDSLIIPNPESTNGSQISHENINVIMKNSHTFRLLLLLSIRFIPSHHNPLMSNYTSILQNRPHTWQFRKVKRLMSRLNQEDQHLPVELINLLKLRWWISMAGVLPLIIVFVLMVYKPDITAVADWFR